MKDKKIIAFKNKRIKKIVFNLRGLIKNRVIDEWDLLGKRQSTIRLGKIRVISLNGSLFLDRNQYMEIEDERSDLYRALNNSLCVCPVCNRTDMDMYYNATVGGWYCTLCVQTYRNFYSKKKAILDRGGFVGDFDEKFHETFL